MNFNPIELKNVKLAKMGSRRIITIPNEYLKDKLINPDLEYDIVLKPKMPMGAV